MHEKLFGSTTKSEKDVGIPGYWKHVCDKTKIPSSIFSVAYRRANSDLFKRLILRTIAVRNVEISSIGNSIMKNV